MSRKTSPPNDAQERNTEIALFRYGLISALLFDPLAAGQLEQALRAYVRSPPRPIPSRIPAAPG